jgi:alpha-ketoglutarate-dependent taurine dioxygenase
LNLTIDANTWPAYVEIDHIKNLSDTDIQTIGKTLAEKTVVVIRNQSKLSHQDQTSFSHRFGDVYRYFFPKKEMYAAICPDNNKIANVTGKRNKDNLPGLHGGHDDLDWHCNSPWNEKRMPIIYLYAVHGSNGSRTSYSNAIHAWRDLSPEWKDMLSKFHIRPADTMDNYSIQNKIFGLTPQENLNFNPCVHQVNHAGYDTLFFPWNQMLGLKEVEDQTEYEEIKSSIMKHMLQEKYIYHHDWQDGDIVLADQWSGMHKRWAFELMHERLLHRIGFNYDNIEFG